MARAIGILPQHYLPTKPVLEILVFVRVVVWRLEKLEVPGPVESST